MGHTNCYLMVTEGGGQGVLERVLSQESEVPSSSASLALISGLTSPASLSLL